MFNFDADPPRLARAAADWLGGVMDWVEKGSAPERIAGAHVESGNTTRTHPLCPYPQVARYRGAGSIDDAANVAFAPTK